MKRKQIGLTAMLAATTIALAGCGASNSGGGAAPAGQGTQQSTQSDKWGACQPGQGAKSVADTQGTGSDKDTQITLGAFNGWDESFATAHLLKAVLQQDGYKVDVQQFEAAPAFAGTAKGDIDVVTDVWMPTTHASYIKQYGDKLDQLGCWYNNAKLTIAVNDSSPAKSIADLATMGDQYGGKLYGIEPGAGLTKQTKEKAIPEYGLKTDFVVSSTPAMLAQVDKSVKAKENVAVTLWRPHWAYSAYPMRDLDDPKGAMGGAETILSAGRTNFSQEDPKASQLIKNLKLNDKQLSDLENLMMGKDKYDGKNHDAAVNDWLKANPDFVKQLKEGKLG